MEQKKQFSIFDIINIIVLSIGVVLEIISLMLAQPAVDLTAKIVGIIANAATFVALISGVIYMLMRYTKKSAVFYKIFMYSFVAITAVLTLLTMTNGSGKMLSSIVLVAIFLLTILLATARDMGKVKTYIVAGLLVIGYIVLCFVGFAEKVSIANCLVSIILTIEACVMVLAKYQDKLERGAK